MEQKKKRLGELLVEAGVLTPGQLKTALGYQQTSGGRLAEVLCNLGLVSEPVLLQTLSRHIGIPYKRVGELKIPDEVLDTMPRELMVRHTVLPLARKVDKPWPKLLMAMSEPQNVKLIDELAFATGHTIVPVLALSRDIERAFRTNGVYGVKELARQLELEDSAEEEFVVVRDGSIFQ